MTRSTPLPVPRRTRPPGRLDAPTADIQALAQRLTAHCEGPRARAISIFDFVRDAVRFGFTGAFDRARPARTLAAGRGHCNPQAALFCALLQAVDIEARVHFVTIDRAILDGLFPPYAGPPERVSHAFAEVRLDGGWIPVDGYIVDLPLYAAARARLVREGRSMGHGVHVDGCGATGGAWDGRSRCMSQLVDDAMVLDDHGVFLDPAAFYDGPAYRHDPGVIGRLMLGLVGARRVNRRLDALRAEASPTGSGAPD